MAEPQAFEQQEVREKFLDHYDTLRGRVRSEIVRRHLAHVLPQIDDGGLRILDVGCGDGRDSIWLAECGNEVVGIDSAPSMVAAAQQRARDRNRDAKMFMLGTDRDAKRRFGAGAFDLVLSHGVIMYEPDPEAFVRRHVELATDDGWLSLLAKNFDGVPHRAAKEGSFREALESFDDTNTTGHLGVQTQSQTIQQLATYAALAGGTVASWAGVRMFVDTAADSTEILQENEAIDLEWHYALQDPHRGVAALIHLMVLHGIDLQSLPA
jgi:SAM-dependent methyltransferase